MNANRQEFLTLFRSIDYYLHETPEHKLDDEILSEIATIFSMVLSKHDELAVKDFGLKVYIKEVKGNSINLARMVGKGADKSVQYNYDGAVENLKNAYTIFMGQINNIKMPPMIALALYEVFSAAPL